ncbi:hypothetical protein [Marinitenerispora sediminis]|uniref:Uncharacterized protein n=1 Tax=Marinitenerispora sediminis TaxID=1931232 RepID=A0A368T9P3_9ACTN|nr:hypothetical protein [Marinitenerispora sediminis]RCV54784.1 hypothetical protein DEF28_07515 [Marinitenerispora sediminis]RCV60540.1 hypothetical protein DEF23_04250 [Marinitenerispora sediminis]RCV61006.1 hypothetical protein DEF24_05150 [Marinitenerispora sediminis]
MTASAPPPDRDEGLPAARYVGSGPYCYADSLAMVLGAEAPPPGVVETLTGSPFGVQVAPDSLPYFDPHGWDPEIGLDTAIALLGWRCRPDAGGTPEEAVARLRAACARGPVLAGPVDLGLLRYRPGAEAEEGGDHYLVVLGVEDGTVLLHDPHGHPYATLPTATFTAAWRAEAVYYTDRPFVLRSGFVREHRVTGAEALRRSLPLAARWLAGRAEPSTAPGTLGGADAVEELAARVRRGLDPVVRAHLAAFAVRVGARRLADAARCLAGLDLPRAAAVADKQARIVGGLQYPAAVGDDRELAAGLRRLAPTYERLRGELAAAAAAAGHP